VPDIDNTILLEDAPIRASDSSVGTCAPYDEAPCTRTNTFAKVIFSNVWFPEPSRRSAPILKFTAADLGVSVTVDAVDPVVEFCKVPEVNCTTATVQDNELVAELIYSEPACFSEPSRVASAFAQSFGHLGPDSTAKTWCAGLNFLVSLYPDASLSDKGFVYNLLEELASQMRIIFPKWVNGTNALERKLMMKLAEFDGLEPKSGVDPASRTAASGGASVSHLNLMH
jgi:hypothetical protein